MIEIRQRNNREEINCFHPSFEKNRREKLIEYCQGFAGTVSAAINGTTNVPPLSSELNNMYFALRESLLGTCPMRHVETPRRNRRNVPEQGECYNSKPST